MKPIAQLAPDRAPSRRSRRRPSPTAGAEHCLRGREEVQGLPPEGIQLLVGDEDGEVLRAPEARRRRRRQDEGEARSRTRTTRRTRAASRATRPATASPAASSSFATTPDLVGVQCEMCHGPAGTYLQKEHMSLQEQGVQEGRARQGRPRRADHARTRASNCHNAEEPLLQGLQLRGAEGEGDAREDPVEVRALSVARP